jgi:hypothetical protein
MRNLLSARQDADLVQGADVWAEAAMDAEDVSIYNLSFPMSSIRSPSTEGSTPRKEGEEEDWRARAGNGTERNVRDGCGAGVKMVQIFGNNTNGKDA